MDFAYDADSFQEHETAGSYPSQSVSLNLSSLSTADFTKKLQSLSILDIGRKKKDDTDLKTNAKTLQRIRDSIDLVNSLQSNHDSIDDIYVNRTISSFDSKSYIANISQILETPLSNELSLKTSLKILQTRFEVDPSVDLRHKYNQITQIGPKGSLERKLLQGLVEEDLLQQNSTKLKKFQKVVKQIQTVHPDLEDLFKNYNNLLDSIDTSVEELKDLKSEISITMTEKRQIDTKKKILLAFKSSFTVSQYEEHLLKFANLDDPIVGKEFFAAINKVKEIQTNCDILLAMENENVGLKIMKNMNDLLLSADNRVQSYVHEKIQNVYMHLSDKSVNIHTFQKCLIYLYEHNKSNFDSIMSTMIENRRRTISNEFVSQLRGYTDEVNLNAKNVDNQKSRLFLSSYDTIKFFSDTLAYIHNLIVNEMENARSFLTFDFDTSSFVGVDKKELENMVSDIVNDVISGLNNPLKGAVESILRQEVKLSNLVSSYDLLELYSSMFLKLLQVRTLKGFSLLDTIHYLVEETQDRVFYVLNLRLKKLEAESLDATDSDDDSLNWIIDWNATIDELFEPYNTYKNLEDNDKHILGLNDDQWNDLVSLMINKPLDLIEKIKKNKESTKSKKDKLVLCINYADYFQSKISINKFLTDKCKDIQTVIDSYINELIELEFMGLLHSSGLFDIYNLINMIFKIDDEFFDVSFYQPILENKVFNLETFKIANSKLESFLAAYINQNELDGLMSPTIFNKVFFDSAVKFIEFYKKLSLIVHEYLRDSEGKEVDVFQWDAITIATLLGVDEYYQDRVM
ncbi:hypothetical protein CANINC_002935 [Pichia inconspicua]|uniref:Conserved oligomeric Golgi complex subunit 6 n=1 Tax=Pichia inconspicua TaxID=52247 RepID=A0A4T0WZW4_9ASCO|nr:hypothetical protein CANINC_002935 [[Candida] inconspicua]